VENSLQLARRSHDIAKLNRGSDQTTTSLGNGTNVVLGKGRTRQSHDKSISTGSQIRAGVPPQYTRNLFQQASFG
jgi:hypothetical protein